MLPRPFQYHRPVALKAALDMLARLGDDAAPYAGGTELLLVLKMRFAEYGHLVDLKRLPELAGIAIERGVLAIGAGSTHRTIANDSDVARAAPALARSSGD